ncbi:hypothetical protein BC831DRAFT_474066 [Entophlyctis helioformis]|nr:hypothetical protein BC831DRAFT_474066 [Entophlyctis helioformis]
MAPVPVPVPGGNAWRAGPYPPRLGVGDLLLRVCGGGQGSEERERERGRQRERERGHGHGLVNEVQAARRASCLLLAMLMVFDEYLADPRAVVLGGRGGVPKWQQTDGWLSGAGERGGGEADADRNGDTGRASPDDGAMCMIYSLAATWYDFQLYDDARFNQLVVSRMDMIMATRLFGDDSFAGDGGGLGGGQQRRRGGGPPVTDKIQYTWQFQHRLQQLQEQQHQQQVVANRLTGHVPVHPAFKQTLDSIAGRLQALGYPPLRGTASLMLVFDYARYLVKTRVSVVDTSGQVLGEHPLLRSLLLGVLPAVPREYGFCVAFLDTSSDIFGKYLRPTG